MSYYYKYDFVSPEPTYAIVKEELKSYFDTGAVDDLLFPTYLDKCLKKLGRSSYVISEEILMVEDFEVRLPDNFYAVREAWMCVEMPLDSFQESASFYSQASSSTTIQVTPMTVGGKSCGNPKCTPKSCSCMPEVIQAVYKTTNEVSRSYKQSYLLKPGNISARNNCGVDYSSKLNTCGQNPGGSSFDSFDIRDNKFVTNFRNGVVKLIFYAYENDELGNQLIPDNYRIKEYIETFIKYKVFEQLTNQVNDETFNQLRQKLMDHKTLCDEAYIMAEMEIKKQDAYTKTQRIRQSLNRFNRYGLPRGRRRND